MSVKCCGNSLIQAVSENREHHTQRQVSEDKCCLHTIKNEVIGHSLSAGVLCHSRSSKASQRSKHVDDGNPHALLASH